MIVESIFAGVTIITIASLWFANRIIERDRSCQLLVDVGGDIDALAKLVDRYRTEYNAAPNGSGTEMLARKRFEIAKKELSIAMRAASQKKGAAGVDRMTLALFANAMPIAASFSPCRRWRYTLTRVWAPVLPRAVFCMLNPSTADEFTEDATVRKCIKFAKTWGYGSLVVVNIFAWRSTDPSVLKGVADPVGPDNDAAILRETGGADIVVVAWGRHGSLLDRGPKVLAMLRASGIKVHALATNNDGTPGHPLYLKDSLVPKELTV